MQKIQPLTYRKPAKFAITKKCGKQWHKLLKKHCAILGERKKLSKTIRKCKESSRKREQLRANKLLKTYKNNLAIYKASDDFLFRAGIQP